MLHLKVLRSPHAHARIVSIDKTAALAVPGVHRVYTWEDVPRKRFTTAIHTDHLVDPDDTYMLDNVVRFAGQRVVAVVADSVARRRGGLPPGRRRVRGAARRLRSRGGDGRRRTPAARLRRPVRPRLPSTTSCSRSTATSAMSTAGFAEADVIHEGTYFSPRVQHAHLETHGSIAWMEDGRLNVRTSSQSPSICQGQAVAPVRPAARSAAGVLQARRRRLRRQAGGDLRGPGRAGHARHRAAGVAGSTPARRSSPPPRRGTR